LTPHGGSGCRRFVRPRRDGLHGRAAGKRLFSSSRSVSAILRGATRIGVEKPTNLPTGEGAVEQRKEKRRQRRWPCDLQIGGTRHEATVVDASEGGLSVLTAESPEPGTEIRVAINAPGGAPIDVVAVVWNKRRASPRKGGGPRCRLGLVIVHASAGYPQLLGEPGATGTRSKPDRPGSDASPPPREAPPSTSPQTAAQPPTASAPPVGESGASYRVRLAQKGGPRTRIVVLSASSEEDAGGRALADLGADWRVLAVETV